MSEPREHVVAVGVFDGVHRGHQRILERARERGRARGAGFAVVTFEPHPDAVLGKRTPEAPLTPIGEKCELLEQAGADRVDVLHFDRVMAGLEPETFVRRYLIDALGLVHLTAGQDFALGKNRKGTLAYLADLGARWGFTVDSVPLLLDPDGPVSSTRIRGFLAAGKVEDAGRLLGRPYRIEAQVVRGQGVGKDLGFPTANLELLEHQMMPGDGIYAVWVTTPDGARRGGAMSIGKRPTLGDVPHAVEVFVLDFEGDLVSRPLAVEFVSWIREEKRFPDLETLARAIADDVAVVRERLQRSRITA
ncbi:MAG TPA: bifunctional riboflavin kinase/FAD synthetase [Candidatus Eisenbacteria bacterium]|nr:bifunctional riboflavin kinase/FAD synthetase [Candidatus Eisenbacteria bacterium]